MTGNVGTVALHAFAVPLLVETRKILKTSTYFNVLRSCVRSALSGVSPAAVIAATISRCGYSIAAAGGIDPCVPVAGFPLT